MDVKNNNKRRANHFAFEKRARKYLENKWKTKLPKRSIKVKGDCSHEFDFVSPKQKFIGDAKYLKDIPAPSAKLSGVAEYVWLLGHVKSKRRFLIFGKHIQVPEKWLGRFGNLVRNIEFYFLRGKELKKYNKEEGKFVRDN